MKLELKKSDSPINIDNLLIDLKPVPFKIFLYLITRNIEDLTMYSIHRDLQMDYRTISKAFEELRTKNYLSYELN